MAAAGTDAADAAAAAAAPAATAAAPPTAAPRSSRGQQAATNALTSALTDVHLAVAATIQAAQSPVVRGAVVRAGRQLAAVAAAQWVFMSLLLLPLRLLAALLALLTFFTVRLDVGKLVASSASLSPLASLLVVRWACRADLRGCFFDSLGALDQGFARRLRAAPPAYRAPAGERALKWLGLAGMADELRQALVFAAASLLLRVWRGVPWVGWLVAPAMQALSLRFMLGGGHARAAVAVALLAAALPPELEAALLTAAELWAVAAGSFARAYTRAYLVRAVPRERQAGLLRRHERLLALHFLLPSAACRVPRIGGVLGALAAFPCAALGACCVKAIVAADDDEEGKKKDKDAYKGGGRQRAAL